jgi:hypothetical protein
MLNCLYYTNVNVESQYNAATGYQINWSRAGTYKLRDQFLAPLTRSNNKMQYYNLDHGQTRVASNARIKQSNQARWGTGYLNVGQ